MAEKEAWFLVPKGEKALVNLWKGVEGHRDTRVSRMRFLRLFFQEVARGKLLSDGRRGKFLAWVHANYFLEKRNAQMNVVCKWRDGDNVIVAV